MQEEKEIKCPYCGFKGKPKDFYLLYEAVVNVTLTSAVKEGRERPPLLVCPSCGKAFPSSNFYDKLRRKIAKR
ncbi:MAG: hypothetical protein DRO08_04755 [Thermoprotei archaeon]|nr:MAG: hypothetical protein DRO08_04755 [Thermoprotei archaeon]RLG75573.1 MAG: hypothetical protein DRO23_03515 [Thermoprotei archaeon]